MKKKSHSAPESDSSSSIIYDATPVPKKKLSLDETLMKQEGSDNTIRNFLKEKCQKMQEKDLDEASDSYSVGRVTSCVSPAATLTSVSDKPISLFKVFFQLLSSHLHFRATTHQLWVWRAPLESG